MKIFYFLLLCSSLSFSQTQIGDDIDGEAADDRSGYSVSLSSDGSTVAIGAFLNDGNGTNSGHVRVYENSSGVWTQIGADIDGEASFDQSGMSVSLSSDGSILAIGATCGNGCNNPGYVRVYENVSGIWTQIGDNINGDVPFGASGWSVSLSLDGSIVAIGAPFKDGTGQDSGHVRVYENISGVWTQIGADIDGEATIDGSGYSVSLSSDGNIVAIGAPYNNGNGFNSGHVRVYENISGVWTQIGADIDGGAAEDYSGYSVSLSSDGSIVVIGAPSYDGNGSASGLVRVYENISGVWIQIGADIEVGAAGDRGGHSVSLSSDGSIIAIGAPNHGGNGVGSGLVRVFKNLSGVWTQLGTDIDGEAAGDRSGSSVGLSSDGSIVAIGAPFNDGNGSNSGHVRVYDLSSLLSSDSFVISNFSMYPNPATEIVAITLENDLQLEKVNIYSTLGQLIKTEKSLQINVSDLAKGSYFIEVETNHGKATKTIVVQ
jgi:Flp pilus assembly pilin Flp